MEGLVVREIKAGGLRIRHRGDDYPVSSEPVIGKFTVQRLRNETARCESFVR